MKLNVFFGKEKCGLLSTTENRGIVFQYLGSYLLKPHSKSISLSLPLQQEEFSQKQCLPFFSGLLPEEFTRKRVADYLHISELSTMKLLEALGQECAGFITIADDEFDESNLKTKYEIDSSNYEKISYERLEEFVKNITLKPFIKADDKLRLSLAGAQEKLALAFFNNQWYLPLNGSPSTHILKPTREGSLSTLAQNEYFCMNLAKYCGLSVPEIKLENIAGKDVLIVQRYDRIITDGKISRLHQEDMCQALGIMSEKKYQSDGGPGIKDIYELLKRNSVSPVIDLKNFLTQVLFNYLIGNCDAHSKNYSILYDKKGNARLAPAYDLVSTRVYSSLTQKMSMKIGSHFELKKVCEDDFVLLAEQLNINQKVIFEILAKLRGKIAEFLKKENDISSVYKTASERLGATQ